MAGAFYYVEAFYIVKDDINIFNSMGYRRVTPAKPSTTWTFSTVGDYAQGPAINTWVNPTTPGPGADNELLDTGQGRVQLAVRTTDLGGGVKRYAYAFQNHDFDRRISSFHVPFDATTGNVQNITYADGDGFAANDWTAVANASGITWTAPLATTPPAPIDYASLVSFRFDSTREPAEVSALLGVFEAGSPTSLTMVTLAPVSHFAVTPSSGLTTTEAGGTATFTVVLDSAPTGDVSFNLTSSDPTEGTVSPGSLTFTTTNWNDAIAHTVTVTGVNDLIDDGAVGFTIQTGTATSSDLNFDGQNPPDVAVSNTDDDVAGITVTPTSGLVTTEAGGQATFTIVLTSEPTANVTIGVVSSDTTEGTVSPASAVLTSANWNLAATHTLTVTGVDDALFDGNVPYSVVTVAAISTDGSYNGLNTSDVSVTNTNNDTPGFHTVTPCRILDTRGPQGGGAIANGETRVLDVVAAGCNVPISAKAIVVNVTVVGPTSAGEIALSAGVASPAAGRVQFQAGQTRANNAAVRLTADGKVNITPVLTSAGSTHVVIDVVGYFELSP